jgi:hypothetical protein
LFLSLSPLLSNLRKDCWSGIIVIAAVGVGFAAGDLFEFPLATAPFTVALVVVTAATATAVAVAAVAAVAVAVAAAAAAAAAAGLAGKKNDSISEVAPAGPIDLIVVVLMTLFLL